MATPGTRTDEYALSIETSGAIGSVALGRGAEVLAARVFSRPRAHASEFFPAIERLCASENVAPSQIRHVYVSAGPGSFTGLRIGITAARTLALATGAKIVALPTLEVIAQNAAEADPVPERVAVILDAKREHVYAASFRRDGCEPPQAEGGGHARCLFIAETEAVEADPLAFLAAQGRECAVMGEGVLYHRKPVLASGLRVLSEEIYRPRAEVVHGLGFARGSLGAFDDPRSLIPIYIRPPEAEEKWAAKQPKSANGDSAESHAQM